MAPFSKATTVPSATMDLSCCRKCRTDKTFNPRVARTAGRGPRPDVSRVYHPHRVRANAVKHQACWPCRLGLPPWQDHCVRLANPTHVRTEGIAGGRKKTPALGRTRVESGGGMAVSKHSSESAELCYLNPHHRVVGEILEGGDLLPVERGWAGMAVADSGVSGVVPEHSTHHRTTAIPHSGNPSLFCSSPELLRCPSGKRPFYLQ